MILNIEEDHMDFFKDLDDIRHSFRLFAQNTASDGAVIVNREIEGLDQLLEGLSAEIVTYGFDPSCDFYPENITFQETGCARFSLMHRKKQAAVSAQSTNTAAFSAWTEREKICEVSLCVPGRHNISNALAAAALAVQMGIPAAAICGGLHDFHGTDRRFQYKGMCGQATVIDDYAHHPTEINATLSAAANYPHNRILCVFQPHTYTRTKAFLKEFAAALSAADLVVLADIYAARETDTLGISSLDLLAELEKNGTKCCYFPSFDAIEKFLLKNLMNGDLLITMGAGDIHIVGEDLVNH